MTYDQQILNILTRVGERGISVQAISKHVYNMNCTLFSQPDYDDIRSYVQQYLLRNSRSPQSLITRTDRRGIYRLNTTGSQDALQLMLQFQEAQEAQDVQDAAADNQADEQPRQDLSLSLFDSFFD